MKNQLKHKTKLPKRDTITKLVASEYVSINEHAEALAYKNEAQLIEALKTDKSLKGYIVKTYTINTKTEIKIKED